MKLSSACFFIALGLAAALAAAHDAPAFSPGERVLFEAHNCYPYHGFWNNRIDKALGAGVPLAIEIDVMWHVNQETGEGRLVAAHNEPLTGKEPALKEYFFERVRPVIEKALASDDRSAWPLITLNINDIRSKNTEAYEALKTLTDAYSSWLCSAVKTEDENAPAPLDVKPVLVLTNGSRHAEKCFYNDVKPGDTVRLFGAGSPNAKADNFHRWINYSWRAVEPEGQPNATDWNEEKENRLQALVDNAHERGYWIRFYSLNGRPTTTAARLGLSPGYNFGSLETVQVRWEAAVKAGVDFIATDQIAAAKASGRK